MGALWSDMCDNVCASLTALYKKHMHTYMHTCVRVCGSAVVTALVAFPGVCMAENELASFADGKFNPDLVNSECFATSCKLSTKRCFEDGDCKKGLMCTARCLGDSACITGCFARFGNEVLNDLLQCSIEDYKCINIAIVEPGDEPPHSVPEPPKALAHTFTPDSMEGQWYKVLGWNRQYDCFDCQVNTFHVADTRTPTGTPPRQPPPGADGAGDDVTAALDVDFAMLSKRKGRELTLSDQHMHESVVFDKDIFLAGDGRKIQSRRTAHTKGRMFGLTFWENWYVIGENKPGETPFKFIYYTGKTLQNTYSGAFVYARTPDVPAEAMQDIYRIAREAGLDPEKVRAVHMCVCAFVCTLLKCCALYVRGWRLVCPQFCRIRNTDACFLKPGVGGEAMDTQQFASAQPPLNVNSVRPPAASPMASTVLANANNEHHFEESVEVPLSLKAKALWCVAHCTLGQQGVNERRRNADLMRC